MPPLRYYAEQIAIQEEAKTTRIAEKLAYWIGPVAEFAKMEFCPGDVAIMQPGHDDWVGGDEPNVLIELADVARRERG
jgi:hypothetical protein